MYAKLLRLLSYITCATNVFACQLPKPSQSSAQYRNYENDEFPDLPTVPNRPVLLNRRAVQNRPISPIGPGEVDWLPPVPTRPVVHNRVRTPASSSPADATPRLSSISSSRPVAPTPGQQVSSSSRPVGPIPGQRVSSSNTPAADFNRGLPMVRHSAANSLPGIHQTSNKGSISTQNKKSAESRESKANTESNTKITLFERKLFASNKNKPEQPTTSYQSSGPPRTQGGSSLESRPREGPINLRPVVRETPPKTILTTSNVVSSGSSTPQNVQNTKQERAQSPRLNRNLANMEIRSSSNTPSSSRRQSQSTSVYPVQFLSSGQNPYYAMLRSLGQNPSSLETSDESASKIDSHSRKERLQPRISPSKSHSPSEDIPPIRKQPGSEVKGRAFLEQLRNYFLETEETRLKVREEYSHHLRMLERRETLRSLQRSYSLIKNEIEKKERTLQLVNLSKRVNSELDKDAESLQMIENYYAVALEKARDGYPDSRARKYFDMMPSEVKSVDARLLGLLRGQVTTMCSGIDQRFSKLDKHKMDIVDNRNDPDIINVSGKGSQSDRVITRHAVLLEKCFLENGYVDIALLAGTVIQHTTRPSKYLVMLGIRLGNVREEIQNYFVYDLIFVENGQIIYGFL